MQLRESGGALKFPQWDGGSPAAKRLLLHFQLIWMQFLANIFMQIVLASTSFLCRKKILNEFAIISGPGLETVGGGATAPICPPPRGDANGGYAITSYIICLAIKRDR